MIKFKVEWLYWMDDWQAIAFFNDAATAQAFLEKMRGLWPLHTFRVVWYNAAKKKVA